MEENIKNSHSYQIILTKALPNSYMDFNSCERPKREAWVPGRKNETKRINICLTSQNKDTIDKHKI